MTLDNIPNSIDIPSELKVTRPSVELNKKPYITVPFGDLESVDAVSADGISINSISSASQVVVVNGETSSKVSVKASKVTTACRDFDKIYEHLVNKNTAIDHTLVIKFLENIGVESAEDLSYLEEADFSQLLEYQKAVPRKKLLELLGRS